MKKINRLLLNRLLLSRLLLSRLLQGSLLCWLLSSNVLVLNAQANQKTFLVNGIVAVVNNEPITLHELNARLGTQKVSVEEIEGNQEAKSKLEALIFEKTIAAEAEKRRITADPSEVERYLIEVASNNGLSLDGFTSAMKAEGRDMESFKNEVKTEILRSKIASYLIQEGSSVSEQEIDEFLTSNPQFEKPGVKVQIKQIFLEVSEKRNREKAHQLMGEIKNQLDTGADFEALAVRFSEAGDGQDGGDLGLLDENDLNPLIKEAVQTIQPGEVSMPSDSPIGVHLFKLVSRFNNNIDARDSIRAEVKAILKRQKLTEKVASFFTKDIFERHSVERKA